MSNIKIDKIICMPDYQMKLFLSNGHKIIYDMTSKTKTIRFMEISNQNIFNQAELINNKVIRWDETVEITLEEILIEVSNGLIYYEYMTMQKLKEQNEDIK